MIQTNAKFNTNQLNLPISALVGKLNTQQILHIAYCLISFKLTEAFAFNTRCMKDLFFYSDCLSPKSYNSCTASQHKISILSIKLRAMGVAGTAPKVQGVGVWSQRTAGRPGGRQPEFAAKMLVGDPEPTPQRQKLPLPMRQSPGAKWVRDLGG